MTGREHAIGRATQAWVRATGCRVRFDEHSWLDGPVGDPAVIGDAWLERERHHLAARLDDGTRLLASFDALASDHFDPSALRPEVVDFYERTAQYRLQVWAQWSPAALPFGWLLSAVFARRLQQLTLPLRPLDVAYGMDSRVLAFRRDEAQVAAAWLRTLRSTGQTVYSGCYSIAALPDSTTPSIKVAFPLPNGRLSIFLRPSVDGDGALVLTSPLAPFGDDGAYLVVCDADERGGPTSNAREVFALLGDLSDE